MTIKELQADIASLEARQAELTQGIEATRAELEAAQTDLIDGKKGAGERATTLQARLAAHEGALQALGRRLTAQRRALEEAQEAAEIARTRAAMEEEVRKADAAREALEASYRGLQEAFETKVAEITAAGRALDQARRTHRQLGQNLPEETRSLEAFTVPMLGRYGPAIAVGVEAAFGIDAQEQWRQKMKKKPVVAAA